VPSFAAIAGVAGVLTAGLIRANLQSHLALARVGEQPHSSTPTLLPVWTIFDSDVERRDETQQPRRRPAVAGARHSFSSKAL
jgi:hypothetical protein